MTMQPIIKENGMVRFKENAIVRYLLDHGGIDMNKLASVQFSRGPFSQEDQEQFAQLIGYSLEGYHELSYVSDESALAASYEAQKLGFGTPGCRYGGCELHCGVEREGEP